MNVSTSAATASSASRSAGSRCRLRIVRKSGLLDAYCGLPELLDASLVVGRPLTVVVDKGDGGERRRARSGGDVRPHGPAVAELRVEFAGVLREDPVDERLRPKQVLRSLDNADCAHLEPGVLGDSEIDLGR